MAGHKAGGEVVEKKSDGSFINDSSYNDHGRGGHDYLKAAARVAKPASTLGSIEVNKKADLLLVYGDPTGFTQCVYLGASASWASALQ